MRLLSVAASLPGSRNPPFSATSPVDAHGAVPATLAGLFEKQYKDMIEIDPGKAGKMIGKLVLAGVSFCDSAGRTIDDRQYFGRVLRINADEGLVIASGVDGEEIHLPPDLDQYTRAEPGDYRLRSMDLTVTDPDYLCTWHVHPQECGGVDES